MLSLLNRKYGVPFYSIFSFCFLFISLYFSCYLDIPYFHLLFTLCYNAVSH